MERKRSDVTDEDVGMRAFRVRRAQAVETALRRIRSTIGAGWDVFSAEDVQALEWALGETWAFIERSEWDDFTFSALDIDDIVSLMSAGRRLMRETHGTLSTIEAIIQTLRK
jgi:hypothetical protein